MAEILDCHGIHEFFGEQVMSHHESTIDISPEQVLQIQKLFSQIHDDVSQVLQLTSRMGSV